MRSLLEPLSASMRGYMGATKHRMRIIYPELTHYLFLLCTILSLPLIAQDNETSIFPRNCDELVSELKKPSQGTEHFVLPAGQFECKEPIILDRNNVTLSGAVNSQTGEILTHLKAQAGEGFPLLVIGDIQPISLPTDEYIEKTNSLTPAGFEVAFDEEVIAHIKKIPGTKVSATSRHVYGIKVSNLFLDGNAVPLGTNLFKNHKLLEPFLLQKNEIWGSHLRDDSELTPEERARPLTLKEIHQLMHNLRNNTITIRGASDVHLKHIHVTNARSGGIVTEKFCTRLHLEDILADKNYFDGLAMYRTYKSKIDSVFANENSHAGLSIDLDVSKNTFNNVMAKNNGHQGFFARYMSNNDFVNLTIENNGHTNGADGIFLAQWSSNPNDSYSAVTGNRFTNLKLEQNKGNGIRINDKLCHGNEINNLIATSNTLAPWSLSGPNLLAVDGVKVE